MDGALPAWYARFKAALFALIAGNIPLFLAFGTPIEALETAAWFVLLGLYELETGGYRIGSRRLREAMRALRPVAAAAVAASAAGYALGGEGLDALNSALWIAVVALLELEVRFPRAVARRRAAFALATGALYAGLAALVAVWAARGEWLDAYDALLWLTAFGLIEMNLLRVPARANATSPRNGNGTPR